jgi:SOS-response transcriptional repressor LexA
LSGCHLKEEGILENDLLLVNQTKDLRDNNIVIATSDTGKAVIKKLTKEGDKIKLTCSNDNCPDMDIDESSLDRIWGVVTRVIRDYNPVAA